MDILILPSYLRLEFVRLSWFNKSFYKILISFFECFSITKLCLTVCNIMNCSRPGFPVLHYLPEFVQTQVHWVSDAIQPSHPLSRPSSLALSLSQHQGLFHWVGTSHQVAKVLELQLQHQSFQWIFRDDWFPLGLPDFTLQGALKSLLQLHNSKVPILWCSAFSMVTHPDWASLIQMTIMSTTAGKNPLEEME